MHLPLLQKIERDGFGVIDSIFTEEEINQLIRVIADANTDKLTFRKTNDLFAIRQFLKEVPEAADLIFNSRLIKIIHSIFGNDFFVVKSIYFDKPATSNWFVAYHQDLTISLDKKIDTNGFGPWTTKQNQFAVQPPLSVLQDNFTIRIHLDQTDAENGALKVITGSHLKGIYRAETIDWSVEREKVCTVNKGGVMFMKPLLLHSSGRTTNSHKRRVIHIEFSRSTLPEDLSWGEFMEMEERIVKK